MQVILIEPDENLAQLFELNIIKELKYEVITRRDANDAIDFLKILPDIRTIITKDKVGNEDTAKKISDFIVSTGKSAQVYIVGSDTEANTDFCHILPENISGQQLVESLISEQKIKGKAKFIEGHLPVPIKSLSYMGIAPCDVFVNLKQDCENFKLIKRFNAMDPVLRVDITPYIEKGVEKVFVREEDFDDYVAKANNVFKDNLLGNKLDKESKDEIRNLVLRQIKSIGINEHSLELASTFISDIDKKISTKKDLKSISDIFNSTIGYPFQRSYMCSLLCKLIGDKYDWMDEQMGMNMAIAAVFADTSLASTPEFLITNDDDLLKAKISTDRKKIVKSHAKISADKLANMDNISPQIEQLVRYHHGNTNGDGYYFNLGAKMSPVIAVFIVADNFARLILSTSRARINTNAYVKEIKELFPDKRIEEALVKLIEVLQSAKK